MKIKRYDIVFDQYPSDDGERMVRTPPYIAPQSDGMYMLYADHMEIMESIGAGGVTGNIDALDAIIAQCEKISNRLGFDDYQEAVLEGDLTLAEALRASAWEVSLIGTLAKNLKEKVQQKTVEQHHKEFEGFLRSESAPLNPTSKLDQVMIGYAWNVWKAAKGIKE